MNALRLHGEGFEPVKFAEALRAADETAKGKLVEEWAENLKHLAGYLTGAARDAGLLLGTNEYTEAYRRAARQPEGSVTQVDKLFAPMSRLLARLLGGVSRFQCVPATNEQQDKDAAGALEKLLTAYWYNEDMMQIVGRAILMSIACSHSFLTVEGDETLGEPLNVPVEGNPETGEAPGVKVIPQGDVVLKVHLAEMVSLYPGIRRMSDSPAIRLKEFVTEEEFTRRWGPLPANAPAASYVKTNLGDIDNGVDQSLYEVLRLFIKPDRANGKPLGEQYVIVGNEVVYEYRTVDGRPWIGYGDPDAGQDVDYPFIDFADLPFTVGYWARGRQARARAPLKILNIAWTKASQVSSLPGVIIGVPLGSDISREQINNSPVCIIKYNPASGKGIEFWTPPRMAFYEWVISMSERWIDEVFAQSDLSRGIAPGSRFPFKEAELLTQEQQVIETPYGRALMEAISRTARKIASEGRRVWPDEKIGLVLGNDRRWERVAFKKATLASGWDIRIVPEAPLPEGRAARWSALADSVRSGVFADIGPAKAREMLGLYSEDDVFRPHLQEEAVVRDEEALIAQGQTPPRRWFDSDKFHLMKHMERAIERANQSTPAEDEARQKHVAFHMTEVNNSEARQQQPVKAQAQPAEQTRQKQPRQIEAGVPNG